MILLVLNQGDSEARSAGDESRSPPSLTRTGTVGEISPYHSLTGPSPSANESLSSREKMANLEGILRQLRVERARAESGLQRLDQAISAIQSLGATSSTSLKRGRGRRTLSPDDMQEVCGTNVPDPRILQPRCTG